MTIGQSRAITSLDLPQAVEKKRFETEILAKDVYKRQELITVLGTLQKNNLTIGIPNDYNFLAARIYQAGGELFTEDGARSLLDSKEAMDVFKTWTNFYASYGIPVDFDPANRFPTGEMPIVINMLDFYTKMQYLAPELAGLWDFYPIPGTRREDGTIDRTGIIIGQCSMILATSKQPENAWKFLDWWTSVDVQAKNAQEYEMTMGSAYRYTTANVEAMKSLSWTKAELATILDVWETTRGIPCLLYTSGSSSTGSTAKA